MESPHEETPQEDPTPEVWITRKELATRTKIPHNTLNQWASRGKGPRYARFGSIVRYRLADVVAWEESQIGDNGSASSTENLAAGAETQKLADQIAAALQAGNPAAVAELIAARLSAAPVDRSA